MKIQILTVEKSTPPGKKYIIAEVNYKNLTFGKIESKKIFSFGDQAAAFTAIADSKAGDVFEISVVKNEKGYNDWITATQEAPGAVTAPPETKPGFTPKPAWQGETTEERAKKQVLIVRQSSIASAVAALVAGAKSPPKAEDVISYAQQLTEFVFSNKPTESLFEQPNDLPLDDYPD